jgi:1-acyl-sn-glycerol-3-phosphate acyltransferase
VSVTWRGLPSPPPRALAPRDRLRVARRLALLALAIGATLAAFLPVRALERPLHGARRPWTPRIKRAGFRVTLAILGVRWRATGRPFRGLGAQVANHTGWLDIWALNAASEVTFVSKAEVRQWPVMGWMAAVSGTVFISRRRGEAASQQAMLAERLAAGDTLAFFPEGTSTDGRRVLPFKSTLFATFLAPGLEAARVQPVTLAYRAPEGERADLYGWWGDMSLVPHLVEVLAVPRRGEVEIVFHEPVAVRDHPDRKALAALCEAAVRDGLRRRIGAAPRVLSEAAR